MKFSVRYVTDMIMVTQDKGHRNNGENEIYDSQIKE